ncbi:MAG: dihydrofolate reductase [Paludibacteraceae bacterium]|jgi:dihydrofolate reductase|nr:dihydrofolate reductase [Paludibacteraceae bacterium]OQA50439.1 MAG: Dihydrofolate reductase [Bacteroidetes bacterium ADurb.Bin302]
MPNLVLIVAMDEMRGIGYKGQLLCYLPNDLKHFKQLTTGHTVIMGRKTYDSLPNGALPNRRNIVISRQKDLKIAKCEVVDSLDSAFALCSSDEDVFVIGGASIYSQALAHANRLELTIIDGRFESDVFFPNIDTQIWRLEKEEKNPADEKHKYSYSFVTYLRK